AGDQPAAGRRPHRALPHRRPARVPVRRAALPARGIGSGARGGRSAGGTRPLDRDQHRLGPDDRVPPAPVVARPGRRGGDGHGAARHGARLGGGAGADPPLAGRDARLPRRGHGERRRHGPPRARPGRHRGRRGPRLRGTVRGGGAHGRAHHSHGLARPRPRGARTCRLRARLRPHPRRRARAGHHPLAGRDVRPGAGRLLGERRPHARHGNGAGRHRRPRGQGGRREDLAPRQGEGDRHAAAAAGRRPHVHGRRLRLRGADRGRRAGPLGRAARHLRPDRAGGGRGAGLPLAGRPARLPRHPGVDRAALAPHLPQPDALLQDGRGVHGLAERPPGPLHHAGRAAIGALRPALRRAVPPGRPRRAALRPGAGGGADADPARAARGGAGL
ncbi:MAG: Conserved hypothetical protein potentially related to ribose or hydroxymethylpyrimidine metabolism, partial [uncultured Microvirga sp.]